MSCNKIKDKIRNDVLAKKIGVASIMENMVLSLP